MTRYFTLRLYFHSLLVKYFAISHSDSSYKYYLFHPRYFHKCIFRYMTLDISAVLQLIAKLQPLTPLPHICSYLSLVQSTQPVRAAAKISAGGVGSPLNQLYPDMARYFTLRLYFHSLVKINQPAHEIFHHNTLTHVILM